MKGWHAVSRTEDLMVPGCTGYVTLLAGRACARAIDGIAAGSEFVHVCRRDREWRSGCK